MTCRWILKDNHLAISMADGIYFPPASNIVSARESCGKIHINNYECGSPELDIPDLKFSRFNCTLKIELACHNNDLTLSPYVEKNGNRWSVIFCQGKIIDSIVVENRWFFISNVDEFQEVFNEVGVTSSGTISLSQYLKLKKFNLERPLFEDNVDSYSLLKTPNDGSLLNGLGLNATLYPYQKTGFEWMAFMLEQTHGCILGDEMGLGKTLQIIAILSLEKRFDRGPALVIAPISLLDNWVNECRKFSPTLKTLIHHGSDRTGYYKTFMDYDVVITSYSTLCNDIHFMNMICWNIVILDEAQNIKNFDSERAKKCKAIRRNQSIAVTGTPFENHISDILSLLEFIQPNVFNNAKELSEQYSDDVNGGKQIASFLSTLMIRRVVANVSNDLPAKVVINQPIRMSREESERYVSYINEIKQSDSEDISIGMFTNLRMFCSHPFIVSPEKNEKDPCNTSVKYQRLCEIMQNIIDCGEKALIFTSYVKMFELMKADFINRWEIQASEINGSTPIEERQKIVDAFNASDKSEILLLNPRAAGVGLNITGANHVIHYNLEWNPSLEAQATARSYRNGQKKNVFVYRLYYQDTIEEIIQNKLDEKKDIADVTVTESNTSHNKKLISEILTKLPI